MEAATVWTESQYILMQSISLVALISAFASMISGYFALSCGIENKRLRVVVIASTCVNVVQVFTLLWWHFIARGYAWPQWTFNMLILVAFVAIAKTFLMIVLHTCACWFNLRRS